MAHPGVRQQGQPAGAALGTLPASGQILKLCSCSINLNRGCPASLPVLDVYADGGVTYQAYNSSTSVSCVIMQHADVAEDGMQSGIDRGWFQAEKASHGRGRPSLPVLLHTARTIAAGMAYLHSRDIIHGDLCGGNVLLTATDALPHRFTAKARQRNA